MCTFVSKGGGDQITLRGRVWGEGAEEKGRGGREGGERRRRRREKEKGVRSAPEGVRRRVRGEVWGRGCGEGPEV